MLILWFRGKKGGVISLLLLVLSCSSCLQLYLLPLFCQVEYSIVKVLQRSKIIHVIVCQVCDFCFAHEIIQIYEVSILFQRSNISRDMLFIHHSVVT